MLGPDRGEADPRRLPCGRLRGHLRARRAAHTLIDERGLYVAFGEAPAIVFFEAAEEGRFVSRSPGPYAMEIHAAYADGELTWAWHWAATGSAPREMSRAVCTQSEF
jgi:hypothetical protein